VCGFIVPFFLGFFSNYPEMLGGIRVFFSV
jgi:hypothetical protein